MNEKMEELYKEFAFSNNPYKIGDVITDHFHTIKIEKIEVSVSNYPEYPECFYVGPSLDKRGNPKKRQNDGGIYQSNIIKN